MSGNPNDLVIEQAASAFRERNTSGRVLSSPAWHDLSPADRDALFALQVESRLLECALDRGGLSATARAVLDRLR